MDIVKQELKVQNYWQSQNISKKFLEMNKGNQLFRFLEGPPFCTGTMHNGHILSKTIKDTIVRHFHKKGFDIKYNATWDTHGLPIEGLIEKQLGLYTKDQIEEYGIANFNDECRKIIYQCIEDWDKDTKRLGQWIDFENQLATCDLSYMNVLWEKFSELYEKGYVYEGTRVMPYSAKLGTSLSNFEAKQNYKDVDDDSAIVKFKSVSNSNLYYLVWTTTPWTLSSNMALCINMKVSYSTVEYEGELYILAQELIKKVFGKKKYKIIDTYMGHNLINNEYEPIMDYYKDKVYTYKIVADNFVTTTSGTGIVHLAPAFGADDHRVCLEHNLINKDDSPLQLRCHIDAHCNYLPIIHNYSGRFVKDCDKDIMSELKQCNQLFKKESINHSYPFCYRTDTPLIYRVQSTWFLEVTKIKEKLLEHNLKSSWYPKHVQMTRFHNWLEEVQDWNIARERYWGTCIPLWVSEDKSETYCVKSVQHLEELANLEKGSIKDLHREFVDKITFKSPKTGKLLTRIPYVYDCWLESGMLPYVYYNNKQREGEFNVDFIAEGLDQTRGWFYTLHVLSVMLDDKPAFNHNIINGIVLAEDGKKMSKRLKNYTDPIKLVDEFGADALRMYLLSSSATKAEPLKFKDEGLKEVIRAIHIPLNSAYTFLRDYVNLYENTFNENFMTVPQLAVSNNKFNMYLTDKLQEFKVKLMNDLDEYNLSNLYKYIREFVDILNNNYIRLNRSKFKSSNKEEAYEVLNMLCIVLYNVSLLLSPILPFYSENLHQSLIKYFTIDYNGSVHLKSYSSFIDIKKEYMKLENITEYKEEVNSYYKDNVKECENLFKIISLIGRFKAENKFNLSKPLNKIVICLRDKDIKIDEYLIKKDCRIINIEYEEQINKYLEHSFKANQKTLGKKFRKESKIVNQLLLSLTYAKLKDMYDKDEIKLYDNKSNKTYKLDKDDLEIDTKVKPYKNFEYIVNDTVDILIYFDMNETEETIMRNYIDILTSTIQNKRKELGLKVWNKIELNLITENELLIKAYNKYKNLLDDILSYELKLNEKDNYDNKYEVKFNTDVIIGYFELTIL
jgi:isoleucyl-tRNA synthetase